MVLASSAPFLHFSTPRSHCFPGTILPGPLLSGHGPPRFRSSQFPFLPGPTLPRHGSLLTLWVLGSSLKLGCWRRNASTSEGSASMIGDYLTPQPPLEAERRPGRKQISRSRKCSKMAAVMALAVLRRRMTRWPQWAYTGPVSGGSERILPNKTDREGPGPEWGLGGPCPRRQSSELRGAGLCRARCLRLACVGSLDLAPRPIWSPQAPFCAIRRSVFGVSVRSGEKGSDLGAVDAPFFSARSGLLGVLCWERVGHQCC